MKQTSSIESKLKRWRAAGIIGAATSERIAQFEAAHERRSGLNWPVFIALLLGGILVVAGVMLVVAAHRAELSPSARFALVLSMVAAFHLAGEFSVERFPALSTPLNYN